MYTLVLMSAISTAPATPQFDGFFRDVFRGSCNGSCNGHDSRSSCNGSCCGGGLFHGRIRNFFADLFDGGSCHGSCNGSCNGSRPRERNPLPNSHPYDRGLDPDYARAGCNGSAPSHGCTGGMAPGYARSGCNGSAPYAYGGCTGGMAYGGGCTGSTPLYLGSCFGSNPNYSCFGSSCNGGMMPLSVPNFPCDFAQQLPVGMGSGAGCDCQSGGIPGAPFGGSTPGLPQLGSPIMPGGFPRDYPAIPSPRLPGTPSPRPSDDFDNPAQPQPADGRGAYKLPVDDDANRGRVQVRVPTDAKLFVEGKPLSVKDGERTFVTPPLPTDREAVYTFKVEYTRDGDTMTQSRKVRVKANGTTVVDFTELSGSSVKADPIKPLPPVPLLPMEPQKEKEKAAPPSETVKVPAALPEFDSRTTNKSKTEEVPTLVPPPQASVAKITVKLPKGATLYVNGGKNERTELVREFTTPTLTPGKAYQYTMRAELPRNGLPEYQESKVDFKAGDVLTVDFTSLSDPPADRRASK